MNEYQLLKAKYGNDDVTGRIDYDDKYVYPCGCCGGNGNDDCPGCDGSGCSGR